MAQTEFVHSTAPGSPCRSASEAARFDPRVVGSAREGSDGDEGLGSLKEEGELPARSPGRGPLRPLQVHVSTTGARRLSLGPRADPRLGHLRQVHSPPLTGPQPAPVEDRSPWLPPPENRRLVRGLPLRAFLRRQRRPLLFVDDLLALALHGNQALAAEEETQPGPRSPDHARQCGSCTALHATALPAS